MAVNLTGVLLTALGKWTYPDHYMGAFVLGNLLVAILMRNELFGRFLYLLVNTLFAKVCRVSSFAVSYEYLIVDDCSGLLCGGD